VCVVGELVYNTLSCTDCHWYFGYYSQGKCKILHSIPEKCVVLQHPRALTLLVTRLTFSMCYCVQSIVSIINITYKSIPVPCIGGVCTEAKGITFDDTMYRLTTMTPQTDYHVQTDYDDTTYRLTTMTPCTDWLQWHHVQTDYNDTMYRLTTMTPCTDW
jgi:hypothetical protein